MDQCEHTGKFMPHSGNFLHSVDTMWINVTHCGKLMSQSGNFLHSVGTMWIYVNTLANLCHIVVIFFTVWALCGSM